MVTDLLEAMPVVPLVQAEDPSVAVKTARALLEGGLDVIEVVLRTEAALDCLEAIDREVSDVIVGAGTVLSLNQAEEAHRRGAKFIVSPGLDEETVEWCADKNIEVFPGVVTASEVQRAWNLGLRTVKFFPAGLSGGAPMLKALGSVFREMQFMPTGGVSAQNLAEYLALPGVIACGGSWLTPQKEIDAGNFKAITDLARDALAVASEVRR